MTFLVDDLYFDPDLMTSVFNLDPDIVKLHTFPANAISIIVQRNSKTGGQRDKTENVIYSHTRLTIIKIQEA